MSAHVKQRACQVCNTEVQRFLLKMQGSCDHGTGWRAATQQCVSHLRRDLSVCGQSGGDRIRTLRQPVAMMQREMQMCVDARDKLVDFDQKVRADMTLGRTSTTVRVLVLLKPAIQGASMYAERLRSPCH